MPIANPGPDAKHNGGNDKDGRAMKPKALRRCSVIFFVAIVMVSISISGCESTTARPVAVKTDPPSGHVMPSGGEDAFERALLLAAAERDSQAREVLDPLLRRNPHHARARVLHGVLRAREGRVGDAIEIFETLRREAPDMPEPYNNLAVLYTVEGRLDDARKILLESLERRPDAVTYANLGEVYAKLAHDANERARELDAGVVASPSQEATPVSASSQATAGPAQTEPREGDAHAGRPVAEPHLAAAEPDASARTRPDPTTQAQSAAPEPADSAPEPGDPAPEPVNPATAPSAIAADVRAPNPQAESTQEATTETVAAASKEASTPHTFCADAGGFRGRRAVADAALWLQSFGAEVIEVRHEERRIADGHWIYLPPFENRRQADAKLQEIRALGVRDVAVIPDGDLANGISFGIYKNADNANRRVAALEELGQSVRSRVTDEEVAGVYMIKARSGGSPDTLDTAWTSQFPGQSIRVVDCG